ncbi:hypothetical protein TWF696_003276 [Orbilia brochopaga]|uniref:Uncharacterized protein n=1 Tax=Orbilia brochopaga TaxID=3140254 RepID=A0AAV9TXI8_9PEZI
MSEDTLSIALTRVETAQSQHAQPSVNQVGQPQSIVIRAFYPKSRNVFKNRCGPSDDQLRDEAALREFDERYQEADPKTFRVSQNGLQILDGEYFNEVEKLCLGSYFYKRAALIFTRLEEDGVTEVSYNIYPDGSNSFYSYIYYHAMRGRVREFRVYFRMSWDPCGAMLYPVMISLLIVVVVLWILKTEPKKQ